MKSVAVVRIVEQAVDVVEDVIRVQIGTEDVLELGEDFDADVVNAFEAAVDGLLRSPNRTAQSLRRVVRMEHFHQKRWRRLSRRQRIER